MATINGQLVTKTVNEQTIIFRVRDATSEREWAFAVSKEMVDNRPAEETLHYAAESLARRMPDSVYDQELDVDAQSGYRRHERGRGRMAYDVDGYTPGVAVEAHQRYNRQFAERAPRWYDGQVGRPAEGGLVSRGAVQYYYTRQFAERINLPFPPMATLPHLQEFDFAKKKAVAEKNKSVRMIRFRVG